MIQIEKFHRPWGYYENLKCDFFSEIKTLQKKLYINPGQKISLQRHKHRNEDWTVISGNGLMTVNEFTFPIKENDNIKIPIGAIHRVENTSLTNVLIIFEIQSSETILSEDDIERFDDVYGRI